MVLGELTELPKICVQGAVPFNKKEDWTLKYFRCARDTEPQFAPTSRCSHSYFTLFPLLLRLVCLVDTLTSLLNGRLMQLANLYPAKKLSDARIIIRLRKHMRLVFSALIQPFSTLHAPGVFDGQFSVPCLGCLPVNGTCSSL